jgi:glycosyltransferase involved in cell wall biosynthesis
MTQQVRHHCSDVDWVLAHWAFPAGMAANRALMSQGRKPRLALWCHSSDVYALERIPLGAHIARRSLKRAEQIFVPSRDLAERLRRLLGPSKKIEVLHPGIDLGPPPESMPKGPLKVLFVGRLEDIKGLDVVVKLASLNPQWTFTVVGRGDQEARLRAAAARYTNLKVLGALAPEAIRSQLDSHHVLLAPGPQGKTRRTEGLPTVILEALAAGRAVVAGDTGGCSEVVNDEVGFLVPSGDFRACAAALQILSDSPSNLRSKSMAARDRARDFDSREIAKKIKGLLF